MPSSDPAQILIETNRWANTQLIEACKQLSDEQFHQEFEMGCGSLSANLVHIVGAMRGWGDLLAGREQRPRLEESQYSLGEIESLHNEIADDLEQSAFAHPLDESVTGERGGRSYTFQRGAVITHVTTHGMHHRAQCLNMLRQLGVSPLPLSAVVEWMLMVDK